VRPPFGEVDAVKAELVGLAAQPQDEICTGLKWRERHTDTVRLIMLLMLERLIGSPRECVVVMRVHETVGPFVIVLVIESPFAPNRYGRPQGERSVTGRGRCRGRGGCCGRSRLAIRLRWLFAVT
jgi:hypothetical protein